MFRQGATRIRLVVTLSIVVLVIVVLIGLFVPAVEKVRESAARLQTNNNLKQCALSVHAYHDNFNTLPNGYSTGGQMTTEVSMWYRLLPFVESNPAYSMRATDIIVSPYLAPADPYAKTSVGVVNFAANVRIVARKTLIADGQMVDKPGIAVDVPVGTLLCGIKLKEIEDGTTNTILLSTRYSNCGGKTTWLATDAYGNCALRDPPSPGMGGFMGAGCATTPPTRAGTFSAMFQLAPSPDECVPDAGLFGHSFGVGGMSVALCDSAVRNISPTMSPETFSRALCPCDGQKLDADWSDDE